MRSRIRTIIIFLMVLLLVCLSSPNSMAQKPRKRAATDNIKYPPFCYTVRPILIPAPPIGPVLPKVPLPTYNPYAGNPGMGNYGKLSFVNPLFSGKVMMPSYAFNNAGETAFSVAWDTKKGLAGGVYTEKRKVVSVGDVIGGMHIYGATDIRINEKGQVSYRADVGNGHAGIFVEQKLAFLSDYGGGFSFAETINGTSFYELGEDGVAYAFKIGAEEENGRIHFTVDGTTWHDSQVIPSLIHRQNMFASTNNLPSDQPPPPSFTLLPEDVAQKIAARILEQRAANSIIGRTPSHKDTITPSVHGFNGPSGLICYSDGYEINKVYYEGYKANGLLFTAGDEYLPTHNFDLNSRARSNNKGQILLWALPRVEDTRMFGIALATPTHEVSALPAPSLLTLANLCNNVYSGNAGYSDYKFIGNNKAFVPSTSTHVDFVANIYATSDFSQIIVAIRGTVPNYILNIAADKSFGGSVPTVAFAREVSDGSALVQKIQAKYPQANITLTGHSLGGAIAQLLGKASGLSAYVFNAPGAELLYNNLQIQLDKFVPIESSSGTNVNYRIYGDQVSLFGQPIGETIILKDPPYTNLNDRGQDITPQTNPLDDPNLVLALVHLHSMTTMLAQIADHAPQVSNTGEPNFTARM